jgi:hypothetical protein
MSSFEPDPRTADRLERATDHADWRRIQTLYRQYCHMAGDGASPDALAEIRAGLAVAFASIHTTYAGDEARLAMDTLAVLSDIDGRESIGADAFRACYQDRRFIQAATAAEGRNRQPTLFETVIETCRRLRDIGRIRGAFCETGTSGVLCGSMSYGRFYSVRGADGTGPASDLDLIVVMPTGEDPSIVGRLFATIDGISVQEAALLGQRSKIFSSRYDDGRSILSHKLPMWIGDEADPLCGREAEGSYDLSLHLVPETVLEYALVASSARLLREHAGWKRTIRDYRNRPTTREDRLLSFAGRRRRLDRDIEEAEAGYLRTTSAYYIDEADHYHPGFLQTLVQPKYDLCWDRIDIAHRLEGFRHKFIERLRYERRGDEFADLRPSFAHLRRGIFAPHVVHELDEHYSPD